MTDQKVVAALQKRRFSPRNLLIGVGIVALVTGGGAGAFAIAQPWDAAVGTEAEPTETPEVNESPTASFSFVGVDGLSVSVDGSNSFDPEGSIASYDWDFGDGQVGTGATVSHSYGDYGTYTVTLTVTDSEGAADSYSADVTFNAPPPPPSDPEPPVSGAPGSLVPFIPSSDPNNANGGDYLDPGLYCQTGSASGNPPRCD